ncbi:MAG: YIP1 family protein [Lentisphaeria bacterium]|nr:YIP1 family protein [Lentisphaeria bacterium]
MGFWKTLFQVCSGTDVFLRLAECRFWKAFFHLILLTLILAFLLAWGHSCLEAPKIRQLTGSLFNEIGCLRFTETAGIRTGKNPEKKQNYLLDNRLRFNYYPKNTLAESDIQSWNTPFGLIVMDNGIVFWAENYAETGRGKYLAAPLVLDRNPMKADTIQTGLSGLELYHYLKKHLELQSGQKVHFLLQEVDGKLVTEYLVSCLSAMIFIAALFSILLLTVGTVLFFSAMQFLLFALAERHPTFPQVLVILIYAAFPALIIAALYSFFMLPVVSPQTVFFVVYFLYYMVIFRKIRLKLNPPCDPGSNEDDF